MAFTVHEFIHVGTPCELVFDPVPVAFDILSMHPETVRRLMLAYSYKHATDRSIL